MKNPNRKTKFVAGFVLITVLAGVGWFFFFRGDNSTNTNTPSAPKSSRDATLDEIGVGRKFTLPGLDPQNTTQKKGTVEMTVTRARKLNQIRIKGEPVDAPEDKSFLAIDLELENTSQESVGFFARDFFRLIKDNKPYAPQFYNRGVGIAPVSVKNDRIAFLIDRDLKKFRLQVGELQNAQEILQLEFKK